MVMGATKGNEGQGRGKRGVTYTRKMTLVGGMASEALRGAGGDSGEGIRG